MHELLAPILLYYLCYNLISVLKQDAILAPDAFSGAETGVAAAFDAAFIEHDAWYLFTEIMTTAKLVSLSPNHQKMVCVGYKTQNVHCNYV